MYELTSVVPRFSSSKGLSGFSSPDFSSARKGRFKTLPWGKARFEIGDKVKLTNKHRTRQYPSGMERKIFIVLKTVDYPVPAMGCKCGTPNPDRHTVFCPRQFSHPQGLFLKDLSGNLVYEIDEKGHCLNGRFYGGDFVWVKDKK